MEVPYGVVGPFFLYRCGVTSVPGGCIDEVRNDITRGLPFLVLTTAKEPSRILTWLTPIGMVLRRKRLRSLSRSRLFRLVRCFSRRTS